MTEMPIEHAALAAANGGGAHALPAQPDAPAPTIGRHAWVPKWFRVILHATHAGVDRLTPVIMSPEVDQLIEAALRAEGLGVEAQVFHAALDLIEGAASRRQAAQGSGPQPVVGPVPYFSAATPPPVVVGGSGPQPFLPAPADGSGTI